MASTQFLKGWSATTGMLDRNSFDQLPATSRHALALVCKGCQPVADYEAAWADQGTGAAARSTTHGHAAGAGGVRRHLQGRAMLGLPAAARVKRAGWALLKQAVKQHESYGWRCLRGGVWACMCGLCTGGGRRTTCMGCVLPTSAAPMG